MTISPIFRSEAANHREYGWHKHEDGHCGHAAADQQRRASDFREGDCAAN